MEEVALRDRTGFTAQCGKRLKVLEVGQAGEHVTALICYFRSHCTESQQAGLGLCPNRPPPPAVAAGVGLRALIPCFRVRAEEAGEGGWNLICQRCRVLTCRIQHRDEPNFSGGVGFFFCPLKLQPNVENLQKNQTQAHESSQKSHLFQLMSLFRKNF